MAVDDDLGFQLAMLTGFGAGQGWLEVRYRHRNGMRARFYPASSDHRAIRALIARQASQTDVYIGCALRARHRGDRAAVGEGWAVWAECDSSAASAAAKAFDLPPTLVVASGTEGHTHAYWGLRHAVTPHALELTNRRLAVEFDADPVCCDASRILRPCGSASHKRQTPVPVAAVSGSADLYDFREILALLPAITASRGIAAPRIAGPRGELMSVSPHVYVPALTGRSPGLNGKIRCPLHADRTPSFHAFPTAEQGWFCFGACRRGGTIIDLAAAMWSLPPRGKGYLEILERLGQLDLGGSDD